MSGTVPNDPRLISRAIGAYQKAAGPGAEPADRHRTFHARHDDGRDFVIVLDRDGDFLASYVVRGDGRLKVAKQLPPDLPEGTETRVTEIAPGQYTAAVRLRAGDWVTSYSQLGSAEEARQWARDTAEADDLAIGASPVIEPPARRPYRGPGGLMRHPGRPLLPGGCTAR